MFLPLAGGAFVFFSVSDKQHLVHKCEYLFYLSKGQKTFLLVRTGPKK